MSGVLRSGRAAVRPMLVLLACGVLLAGCRDRPRPEDAARHVAGGEPRRGVQLIRAYGCVDCHLIPGVRGANALVGPPLTRWAHRAYIAGMVPNTPENLIAWLYNPQQIHEMSAMPNVGLSAEEARHIAAYLYTIR